MLLILFQENILDVRTIKKQSKLSLMLINILHWNTLKKDLRFMWVQKMFCELVPVFRLELVHNIDVFIKNIYDNLIDIPVIV